MKKTFLFAAIAAFAGIAAADIRAVVPAAWNNGNTNTWQMNRHRAKLAEIAKTGGADVVFIGDSITHFWENRGKATWNRYFASGKRRAINLGTSADRTEHVLWRITEGGELDGYKAKCILIMIGTNNSGHFGFSDEPPVDTILGIKKILSVVREKQPGARVILTSIFPRGTSPDDPYRYRNNTVNKEIATFADGKNVIWCDFTDKFLDAQGRLSREIFPDLLHPNALGYEIWASAVIPLIDACLAAAPGEAIPSVWPSAPTVYGYDAIPAMALRGSNYWPDRYLEKRNEIVGNGKVEYDAVFVGDSITHIWERKGGEGRALFAELKKKYRILNLGYGGDRTENVLWRMRNGELEGYTAKMFMVMIGTNNGGRDVAGIAEGVKRIVATIRKRHPESKVLLLPIFPRGADETNKYRAGNNKINAIIKNFADGKDVLWLDFNDKFLEPGGKLTKRVMKNDLLHLNETGYQIWWDAVRPTFEKIIGR